MPASYAITRAVLAGMRARAMQARLHRREIDAEPLAGLVARHALEVAQDDHLSRPAIELSDGVHGPHDFPSLDRVVGGRDGLGVDALDRGF